MRFGTTLALADASIQVNAGERLAIVGPSGGGKTTLLHLLNGFVLPSEGKALSFSQELGQISSRELRETRARIALIPQQLGLVPSYRVLQNVLTGRFGSRSFLQSLRDIFLPSREDMKAVLLLLERLGVGEKLFHRTSTLSGGQQQRVAIARALFQNPEALLADEPVSSVDPARARDLVKLLLSLAEERGLTLVMSLHNLELAREYFPRLIGLRAGRVVFDEASAQLDPQAFTRLFDLTPDELLEESAKS